MLLAVASVLMVLNVVSSRRVLGWQLLLQAVGVTWMMWRARFPNLGEIVWVVPFMVIVKSTRAGGMPSLLVLLLNELSTELPLLTVLVFRLIRVTRVFRMVVAGPF